MKYTAFLSFAANIALIAALILLIVFVSLFHSVKDLFPIYFFSGVQIGGEKEGSAKAFNWSGFSTFFGIVLFAFEGAGLVCLLILLLFTHTTHILFCPFQVLPIHNAMKNKQYYPHALVTVLIIVCVLASVFGLVNYLRLLDNTPELMTNAIGDDYATLRKVVGILLIITLIVSFHVLMIPVFEAVDLVKPMRRLRRRKPWAFWVISYVCRLLIIVIAGVPSLTPIKSHFPSFVSLVGATFGSGISFILPPLLHVKILWGGKITKIRTCLDILCLIVMIPASIAVTVFSVIDLIDTLEEDDE